MTDDEQQVVNDRQRLRLLRGSNIASNTLHLEALVDVARRAHIEINKARTFSKELVKLGYWAKTGRAEATRYAITPAGRAYLDEQRHAK